MFGRTIIIGGGAVGLSIAWELSHRGEEVTVIERQGALGRGASWAAAGILPPANRRTAVDPLDQLRGLSHQMFPDWAERLQRISGIDIGFRRCGAWYLADTAGERASMIGMTQFWADQQVQCEAVCQAELWRREPALQARQQADAQAWWVPDECQVRCPDYLRALAAACCAGGVELIVDAPVDDLQWGDQWVSVATLGRRIEGARVVLCGGAWTGQITSRLGLELSVVPVRGQMLLLKTESPLLHSIVNVGHRYVVCRDDGHTLVGSTEEEVGFRPGTSESVLASLKQFATDLVPGLATAPVVGSWSGFRPLTFDAMPMIGGIPEADNVFVAAGHFRSGIHLSPATAAVIADLVAGNQPAVDLEAFRVGKQRSPRSAHQSSKRQGSERQGSAAHQGSRHR